MVAANKFQPFVEHVAEGRVNLGADPAVLILCASAPDATDGVYTDLADDSEIANGNGYITGGIPVNYTSSQQVSGTYNLVMEDFTLTATGAVGPFRYVVLAFRGLDSPSETYLGLYWDNGSNITLANGESVTFDFATNTISIT